MRWRRWSCTLTDADGGTTVNWFFTEGAAYRYAHQVMGRFPDKAWSIAIVREGDVIRPPGSRWRN